MIIIQLVLSIPFEARFHGLSVRSGQSTSSTDISLKNFCRPLERTKGQNKTNKTFLLFLILFVISARFARSTAFSQLSTFEFFRMLATTCFNVTLDRLKANTPKHRRILRTKLGNLK